MIDRPGAAGKWPDLAGRIEARTHILPVRIYYEDTDFSGVVYHANYLRYCERGRSDFLRLIGVEHHKLFDDARPEERRGFAVSKMTNEFVRPARIDDVIEVRTRFLRVSGARFELAQDIYRDHDRLFGATLTAAVIDGNGRPKRLSQDMRETFLQYVAGD
ncbi:MAG: YbgC/FadM family acyl-CoA thioesterase [Hyphomicrobiales bacterium]